MTLSLFPVVISMDFKIKSHWTHGKTGSTQETGIQESEQFPPSI